MAFAAVGGAIMALTLSFGFTRGDFLAEGRALWALPWGKVSLIDVYIGFALFCGWVWFREPVRWRAAVWTVLVLTLGNLMACLYVLFALILCRGDWARFWLGGRAEGPAAAGRGGGGPGDRSSSGDEPVHP